ncbi:MAG: PspC domain-containing protein [Patescibacteria group bacterium]|nr:PspC domain-containing protein [Patescibacteria group bacterium]
MKNKKLYRSEQDRIIAGVFGGMGKYFNVDPTILRLVWVVMTVFTGLAPGLIVYILAAVIIPAEHSS